MRASKPKKIEIISVSRSKSWIDINWQQGDGAFDLHENDNPRPAFDKAMDALQPLALKILHLPESWASNFRVVEFSIGSKGGAATVTIKCKKSFDDASKEITIRSPELLLENPTEEGSYTPVLAEKKASLVWDAVECAKDYVKGERAQGQLPLGGDDDEEKEAKGDPHGNVMPLPGMEEGAGAGDGEAAKPAAKKRGRKPKK